MNSIPRRQHSVRGTPWLVAQVSVVDKDFTQPEHYQGRCVAPFRDADHFHNSLDSTARHCGETERRDAMKSNDMTGTNYTGSCCDDGLIKSDKSKFL